MSVRAWPACRLHVSARPACSSRAWRHASHMWFAGACGCLCALRACCQRHASAHHHVMSRRRRAFSIPPTLALSSIALLKLRLCKADSANVLRNTHPLINASQLCCRLQQPTRTSHCGVQACSVGRPQAQRATARCDRRARTVHTPCCNLNTNDWRRRQRLSTCSPGPQRHMGYCTRRACWSCERLRRQCRGARTRRRTCCSPGGRPQRRSACCRCVYSASTVRLRLQVLLQVCDQTHVRPVLPYKVCVAAQCCKRRAHWCLSLHCLLLRATPPQGSPRASHFTLTSGYVCTIHPDVCASAGRF